MANEIFDNRPHDLVATDEPVFVGDEFGFTEVGQVRNLPLRTGPLGFGVRRRMMRSVTPGSSQLP